jgi:hypothetical protein
LLNADGQLLRSVLNVVVKLKKTFWLEFITVLRSGYTTDRDIAAGQNIEELNSDVALGRRESKAPVQPSYRGLMKVSLGKWRNLAHGTTRKSKK